MIQLVGYYTLKNAAPTGPVDVGAVVAGITAVRRRLDRLVHAAALRPLSDVDRTYLLAMAQDDGPSPNRPDRTFASVVPHRVSA